MSSVSTFIVFFCIEGRRAEETSGLVHDQDIEEKSPAMRFAERLFKIMDENSLRCKSWT